MERGAEGPFRRGGRARFRPCRSTRPGTSGNGFHDGRAAQRGKRSVGIICHTLDRLTANVGAYRGNRRASSQFRLPPLIAPRRSYVPIFIGRGTPTAIHPGLRVHPFDHHCRTRPVAAPQGCGMFFCLSHSRISPISRLWVSMISRAKCWFRTSLPNFRTISAMSTAP
jgi:hypothetical protein